ncbi:MAG: hypothetical protein KF696_08555 [Planctomycetes bacterium]|nr:hypothetical protein [Planctomycetota bacterium]MCW8135599.1 hypothetical protein [Planctomycetota bacterium]
MKPALAMMLLLAPFITEALGAQQPGPIELVKAYTVGDTGSDTGFAAAIDPQGNSLVMGNFIGSVDLDPGPGSQPQVSFGPAVSLTKLAPDGTHLWSFSYQSNHDFVYFERMCLDAAGNIYMGARFQGTLDCDPGTGVHNITAEDAQGNTGNGIESLVIIKLDANAGFVWARQLRCRYGFVSGIAVGPNGTVHVTGLPALSAIDLNPGPANHMFSPNIIGIFVVVLDSNGDYVWAYGVPGNSLPVSSAIAVDSTGATYISLASAQNNSELYFDPSPTSQPAVIRGDSDGFIVKYSASGAFEWYRQFGGAGLNQHGAMGVAVDAQDHVYGVGYFRATSDFGDSSGPLMLTANASDPWDVDIWVLKADTDGDNIWIKTLHGPGNPECTKLAVSHTGVYVASNFGSSIDLDPGTGTAMHYGAQGAQFVLKLGHDGAYYWSGNFGELSGGSRPYSVAADGRGAVTITGAIGSLSDLDPTSSVQQAQGTGGSSDMYVIMLRELEIPEAQLPALTVGQPASHDFAARLGDGAYSWSLAAGSLPPGLSGVPGNGSPAVAVTGTPTSAGTYNFTLRVEDSRGNFATRDFAWQVNPAPIAIGAANPAPGTVGVTAEHVFAATGGDGGALAWSVIQGALPAGMTGTQTGNAFTVQGTPTTSGTHTFRLRVQDGSAGYDEQDFAWVIAATGGGGGNGNTAARTGAGGCNVGAGMQTGLLLLLALAGLMLLRRRTA